MSASVLITRKLLLRGPSHIQSINARLPCACAQSVNKAWVEFLLSAHAVRQPHSPRGTDTKDRNRSLSTHSFFIPEPVSRPPLPLNSKSAKENDCRVLHKQGAQLTPGSRDYYVSDAHRAQMLLARQIKQAALYPACRRVKKEEFASCFALC